MAQYRIRIVFRTGQESYLVFNTYDEAREFWSDTWDNMHLGCSEIVGMSPILDIE